MPKLPLSLSIYEANSFFTLATIIAMSKGMARPTSNFQRKA